MANSVTVEFDPRPIRVGSAWSIVATHPSGQREHISGFHTETEARGWLSNKSFAAWMRTRGYTAFAFPVRHRQA